MKTVFDTSIVTKVQGYITTKKEFFNSTQSSFDISSKDKNFRAMFHTPADMECQWFKTEDQAIEWLNYKKNGLKIQ